MATLNKLKDVTFRNIKPTETEQLLADGGGLYVRVRSAKEGGAVSFRLTYRINGKQKWLNVGTYPLMSLKEAREHRDSYKAIIQEGRDPAIDRQLEKERQYNAQLAEITENAKQKARLTVSKLFELWEKLDLVNRKDGGKEVRRMFEKDVLPMIGDIAVEDVRKVHIINIIDVLLSRGVNRMSKLILSLMRQMFRFAQDRDIIENDPTASIRKSKIGGRDTIRDRYLSDNEIKGLHKQLPDARLLKTSECAIWIILSTCCRIGELCKAQWKHLDIQAGIWKIPAENSKNGKPHVIYLSKFAIQQFSILLKLKASPIWIFPNTKKTDHVCEKSITKQLGDRQLADDRNPMSGRSKYCRTLALADGKWTPHDLRRTGATIMGNLGIRPDVIEKCLNHVEQNKMKQTYQHQTLEPEQKQAWKLLGDRLEILTSETADNVFVGNFSAA
jgi:integrase